MNNWNRICMDILEWKFTMEFMNRKGKLFKDKYWFIFEVLKIIYLVRVFWKINNLENYLESGDVCISIDSSITDYQYFPFEWVFDVIWLNLNAHLFLNKRSLFGLTGKGPWGRITHSEYVIRRYELHLKIGVEDRYLQER